EPSPVKEYDIYIPLFHNDGSPVEATRFRDLQVRLLEFFNGYTFFPQPKQGAWQMGDVTYYDEIVIYRVVSPASRASLSEATQERTAANAQAGGDLHRRAPGGEAVAIHQQLSETAG